MSKDQLKYVALWLFLAGVILIVFLQIISGQNINRLIQGNHRLLNEIKIQNDLRVLESDVLTVESDLRGVVITNNAAHLQSAFGKIRKVETELSGLKNRLPAYNTAKEINDLDFFVRERITFSYTILDAYKSSGKTAAEKVISTGRGKEIRDSLLQLLSSFDARRQAELKHITDSIENNGRRARTWGFVLAAIACAVCVLAFLYVVNVGRQQHQMIAMLNESEKRIKDIAQVKEQFLANMSHEIRTPVNAVLGFNNLLKRTPLDAQQKNYVDYIQSSGENLLTLINDILDVSKIEAGMMSIEEAPFSLNGLLTSVEVMFREKAREKNLALAVFTEPGIHDTLNGDTVRLTQILVNLLSNAVKFTDAGFVHLHVRAVKQSDKEIEIEFRVQDSGPGIAPEKRQRIFDRFQQADAETTRRYGGTGLGLSIVKQLVNLQKGLIQVHSEVGKGSEFVITLPFKPVFDHAAAHAASPEEELPTSAGLRILIAEDNPMNQQLLRHLMKHWQIDYALVNNGREALEALRKETYTLVLMDMQMPEMDGYATTMAIRNELKLATPVVAMTAHAMPGEKEKCLRLGMNEYISKPIKEAELLRLLQRYAQKEPAGERKESNGLINLAYLKELSLGDAAFEQAIIEQFILQVPDELAALDEAVQQNDNPKIKSIAHGLKSSVSYLGLAEKLFPVLQRMEAEAAAREPQPHFREDYGCVKHTCDQAVQEARQLLAPVA